MRAARSNLKELAGEPVSMLGRTRGPGPHRFDLGCAYDTEPRRSARIIGVAGWLMAGSAAMLAVWELGSFSVLIGNGPLLPPAVHQAPPAAPRSFRPAGQSDGGCTQAAINRKSGETTPADCHHT